MSGLITDILIFQHKPITLCSHDMLTVLINSDREDVERLLSSSPGIWLPVNLYRWVMQLITALFAYVTFFMGDNSECIANLEMHVKELEEATQA